MLILNEVLLVSLTAFTSVSSAYASLALLKKNLERSGLQRLIFVSLSAIVMGMGTVLTYVINKRDSIKEMLTLSVSLTLMLISALITSVTVVRSRFQKYPSLRANATLLLAAIGAGGAMLLSYGAGAYAAREGSDWGIIAIIGISGCMLATAFLEWARFGMNDKEKTVEAGKQTTSLHAPDHPSSSPLSTDPQMLTTTSHSFARHPCFKTAADPLLLMEEQNGRLSIVNANRRFLDLLHYSQIPPSGWEPERLFVPELLQKFHDFIRTPEQSSFHAETFLISREGFLVPVEMSLSKSYWEERQLIFMIVRNITQRKEAERKMNASLRELREMIEYQPGLTLKYKEKEGKFVITFCDGQMLYSVGLNPGEALGKELEHVFENRNRNELQPLYEKAWAGETVHFEGEWRGRYYWAQLSPLIQNGQVVEVIGTYVDMTERKRKEKQSIEAAKQLESFINNNSDAIYMIDTDGNVMKVNRSFEAVYGWKSEEVIGKKLPIITEEGWSELEQLFKELDTGKVISGYTSIRRQKNGSAIHVSLTLSPIRDIHGHITAYVEISRDITHLKVAEMVLKESEKRYRSLVENAPDAIIVHSKQHILYMNPAGMKMLGLNSNDVNGTIMDFVHPHDSDMMRERMLRVIDGKQDNDKFELRLLTYHEYRTIEAEAVIIPFVVNGMRAVQLIMRDITEQKIMERRLRQHKESLAHAQRIAQIGNWEMPEGSSKVYLSEEIYRIFGIDKETFTHSLDELMSYVHPDDYELVFRSIIEAENGRNNSLEHRILRNGTVRNVYHQIERLDVDGYQAKLIGTIQDITERKMTEEMLTRQEKMSIVGQLAAGVAHEIRNPLTSIKGFVQMTKKGLGKHYHYDLILSEIDRMESIISELLLLAKPEAQQPSMVDICELLRKVITLVNTQAILNNIMIEDQLPPQLPRLECVENRIKQLFINLFKNAIEAMPDGGRIRITASVAEESDQLYVKIMDEGCGIPADRLKRLGEPFYSTKEKGMGMGLMLSYKIVEEHQGHICFESEVNVGTTVSVMLPLRQNGKRVNLQDVGRG